MQNQLLLLAGSSRPMKLTVVVHTEEEFDWNGGFYPRNNQVTHGQELISFCNQLLETGINLVLAMDYAFVTSLQGQEVVEHFKEMPNCEFATHLHPWVSPPIVGNPNQAIDEYESYPGNLDELLEQAKLRKLTEKIEQVTGVRPTTYLAGRYGIGENSYKLLKQLGYKTDLSISPFTDFRHQKGPDFSSYTNKNLVVEGINCIPHTTGYISFLKVFSNYLNSSPERMLRLNNSVTGKLVLKILGVKRIRLSPEGFSYQQMKQLTKSLWSIGVEELIFSFHSPSVKPGLTPYVKNEKDLKAFQTGTLLYIEWVLAEMKNKDNLDLGS